MVLSLMSHLHWWVTEVTYESRDSMGLLPTTAMTWHILQEKNQCKSILVVVKMVITNSATLHINQRMYFLRLFIDKYVHLSNGDVKE